MRKALLLFSTFFCTITYGQKSYQRSLDVVDPCIGSGISTNLLTAGFEVYPIPTNGNLTFNLPAAGHAVLMDTKGVIILESEVGIQNQWNLSEFSSGIYFLSLYTNSHLHRTKLILEK